MLLDVYLRALASRPGKGERPLAQLEDRFWAAYLALRSSPGDPGEDAAFRSALLLL